MEGPWQDFPVLRVYRLRAEQHHAVCAGGSVWDVKVYCAAFNTDYKCAGEFSS